ncbi:MAG: hypothetical protein HY644_11805 [Acidobacteria bacterium]|nr:hypothetical protein [Acidobacteriota bacterium]
MRSKGRLLILCVSALFVAYAVVGGILGTGGDSQVRTLRELRVFSDVLSKVQSDYVDAPDMDKTLAGALQGLIDALDPNCSYVPTAAAAKLKDRNERFRAGVGAVLAKRYGYAYVVATWDASPAGTAGLKSGDLIESIDGKLTSDLSLVEIESLLYGPEETPVELVVIRSRNTDPIKISVTRRVLESPAVQARMLEPDIGYLRIPAFPVGVVQQVFSKLRMLSSGRLSGLVMDLRGTATGDYDEATKIADLFLPGGKQIGSLKDRRQKIKDFISTDDPSDRTIPLVILTSAGTSGAAEVLAAALKENDRARIIGEKTAGAASLQQTLELEDGALLILTTELFCAPSGNAIQSENAKKAGVQPDEKVPDDGFATNFYYQNPNLTSDEQYNELLAEVDKLQLRRAVEYLRSSLKKAA